MLASVWLELIGIPTEEMRLWQLAARLEELAWAFPNRSRHLRAASLILRTDTADPRIAPIAVALAAHLVEKSGTSAPPAHITEELRMAAHALADAARRGDDLDVPKRHLEFCVTEL